MEEALIHLPGVISGGELVNLLGRVLGVTTTPCVANAME